MEVEQFTFILYDTETEIKKQLTFSLHNTEN